MLQPEQLRAIIKAQPEIIPHLTAQAKVHAIGEEAYYKAIERDPKEPGRKRKMAYERKFADLMKRIFDRQKESIAPQLMATFYASKGSDDYVLDWTDEEKAEAVAMMMEIYGDGLDLFEQGVYDGLPDEFVNVEAAELAKKYAYDEIKVLGKQLNDTTRGAIQNAISSFTQPGFTIADVMAKLPFDYARALRIAVTEVTRTYASANQSAGEAWQKQFPDLTIVKTWYTNMDDKVCDICGPRHMTSVKIDESWGGIDNPPAHVHCRCWSSFSSTLGRSVDMYQAPVIETGGFSGDILESVSDVFSNIEVSGIRKTGALEALDSIDKVHHIPRELRGLSKIVSTDKRTIRGCYNRITNQIDLSSTLEKYGITKWDKPNNTIPVTMAHEFGHLLDQNIFIKFPNLRNELLSVIKNNSNDIFAYLDPVLSKVDPNMLNYYKSDSELIARTYAQYISSSSNNLNMNDAIKYSKYYSLHADGDYGSTWTQWKQKEFEPIQEAWENLFSKIGLLK